MCGMLHITDKFSSVPLIKIHSPIFLGEHCRAQERAALAEDREDSKSGTTLGLTAVIVKEPCNLFFCVSRSLFPDKIRRLH